MPSDEQNHRSTQPPPDDEEIETTFRRLRRDGHSRLEAVRILLDRLNLSLAEAKRVLLTSDTWAEAHHDANASSNPPSADHPPPAPG